jgi:septum formation topological specificity factor MinE
MALTTFGAIMGYAAEMVRRSGEVYQVAVQKAQNPALREALEILLAEERKNQSLMEKTRREHVTEMILEPISGLQQEDYEMDIEVSGQSADADLLGIALTLEEKEKKFFADASARIPLPEVARIFRKMVQKKESNLMKLRNLESINS